ncbi:MAG: hypothetical protein JWP69_1691 [Flaviaesturariibacter sp.]|nr:hypothetical protein [Flaviaesturariibacter sp.]
MKIISVNIPAEQLVKDGLQSIEMKKLGQFVVLAGKNGSGKSRVLNKVHTLLKNKPGIDKITTAKSNIPGFKQSIIEHQNTIDNPQVPNENKIHYRANLQSLKQTLTNEYSLLEWNFIETESESDRYDAIFFVPKNLILDDPYQLSGHDIESRAQSLFELGISRAPQSTLAKIQHIQNRAFNANYNSSDASDEERAKAIEDLETLTGLINLFLGTTIGRDLNGQATLFGFPLGQAGLSDGQKVVLQLCVSIFSQEKLLNDVILMMDEPENHLHPSALIDLFEKFKSLVPNGQIWIATHSIPLLAYFDSSEVWFVENGKISYGGAIPEKVLLSLLGSEEKMERIADFLSLPAQFASSRYAFECLLRPEAIYTGSNDPQSVQIAEEIHLMLEQAPIRVLDYGAGKGRILANVFDYKPAFQEDFISKIDYIAFDEYNEDKGVCGKTIESVYGNASRRYFNDISTLLGIYDKESFDVIIMCNVLHEIDPMIWLELFNENGKVSQLLKPAGILILVEDTLIPHGEKAYQNGFLVLDTPELKDLFVISEKDTDFVYKGQKSDRLKVHLIPKRCLVKINSGTRKKALQSLSKKAKERILSIRKESRPTYRHGKLHGFWVQQFANAELTLAQL